MCLSVDLCEFILTWEFFFKVCIHFFLQKQEVLVINFKNTFFSTLSYFSFWHFHNPYVGTFDGIP